ncbi:glycosyltransferase [Halovivax sp.]|uniref:glycosyltransferase n=1 Tax=Halovivax sp. TaxID=1935978 RepID=UPI0025B91F88|nr:glycosyltransferase [Halovivax sp.]
MSGAEAKTIAFFPEAAYGPALNSVGIAQECRNRGHDPVFFTDPSMAEVFEEWGFDTHEVNLADPSLTAEEKAKYWDDFINTHIPNFDKDPADQLDNYIVECWEAIVDTAMWAEKDLPDVIDEVDPDLICVDNVVCFPAIVRSDVPWVRITSCSENEIPDPNIPPYLSGCRADDRAGHDEFERRYRAVIEPVHEEFNEFLADHGVDPYPRGLFFEPSPYLNLLKYPERLRWERWNELDPGRFRYLNGCVREDDETYEVPDVGDPDDPLVYLSFGSLGAGDTDLLKRLIGFFEGRSYRALINVGEYIGEYDDGEIPANVEIDSWFPQQSVVDQADIVIHHGGNNTFNECLYYGTPALVMPYVWDGQDNATRLDETDHGIKLHRSDWTPDELAAAIDTCLTDDEIRSNVATTSADMQETDGKTKAARLLEELLESHA